MKKNSLLEGQGKIFLLGVIVLLGIFLVGNVSAADWDNVKSYDSNTKTITIKNMFGLGGTIGEAKLITPLEVKVVPGYQKVAEFEVKSYEDYTNALKSISFYDRNNNLGKFSIDYDLKYKTIKFIEVPDYKTTCEDIYNEKNKSIERKCINTLIGSHTEEVEDWIDMNKDLKDKETFIIGIFVNVKEGDHVEWIPTLWGVEVNEWASWITSLSIDLVAYWKFDEGTGTNLNDILGRYNGTLINTPVWVGGILGGALNFTNTSLQYVNITTATNDFNITETDNMSISFWIYPNSSSGIFVIASKQDNWAIRQNGLKMDIIFIDVSDNAWHNRYITSNNVLNVGTWNHIVFSYNGTGKWCGSSGYFSVNGTVVPTTKTNGHVPCENNTNTEGNVRIGKWTNFTDFEAYYFNGGIDEMGIWNRTLTASEASNLYNGGIGITYGQSYSITLYNPPDLMNTIDPLVNFSCYVDDNENAFTKVMLYINGIINETNTSAINDTFYNWTKNMAIGSYNWTCNVTNDVSNWNSEPERFFTISTFSTIGENYDTSKLEGSSSKFIFNYTISNSYTLSSAQLVYNGEYYTGTTINTGGQNRSSSAIITTPLVNSDVNKTFNWVLTFNDTSTQNSTSHNQTILNFELDNCSLNNIMIYNFTMKDEASEGNINSTGDNSSVKVDLIIYTNTNTSSSVKVTSISNLYNQTLPATICINDTLVTETYLVDSLIEYSSNDRAKEFYNLQKYNLNSTSNPFQNITLYDLLTSTNQQFRISYKDSSYLPVSDALIEIQRKYIDQGVFKIVEIPKTDPYGETVGNLVLNDVIYNFVVKKNGEILGTFNNVRVLCQTPAISECVLNLNSFSSSISITNYSSEGDFTYTLTHNRTSRTTSAVFNIPSGTIATVKLNVSDALGNNVCSQSTTSSSGTLSCTYLLTVKNQTMMAKLYKNNVLVGTGQVDIGQTASQIYGGIMALLGIFIMITLIGAALTDSPVITIVLMMVGVILLFGMNLVSHTAWIGYGATILFLIIAIVLILIKAGKRQ